MKNLKINYFKFYDNNIYLIKKMHLNKIQKLMKFRIISKAFSETFYVYHNKIGQRSPNIKKRKINRKT
jgi:hypothetical protein